jgi:hypothetical protein
LSVARRRFQEVLGAAPETVDALVGLGLVAWQRGDSAAAVSAFQRVRAVEPGNPAALEHLDRLGALPPPPRPPLSLPDAVTVHARARGSRFEVPDRDRWRPLYVNGINLGAALPGRFPSEFPDSATYAEWIAGLAAMGANAIRVYTIHPPAFYDAVLAHNVAHPSRPLHVIHGVWAELPPGHDYRHPAWMAEFFAEMRRVVDVLHGRADLPRRAGHASGHYFADVSPWVLALLIGREWEPFSVLEFNHRRARDTVWAGRYVQVSGGTPMDAWLGRALDTLVAYETAVYRTQRPVGYTNWPTLDPMRHPTETSVAEELALRARQGERVLQRPVEYDNDVVGLDATRLRSTRALAAGVFAAFHAYPYYPDFMILDSGYARARSSEGPSNYFGYLTDLKAHHPDMPVLIAEYGVPASRGTAHLQPQGWHHGGHTEEAMAEIDARLTREIAEAGMAGGVLFAWMDEWFKRNWLVTDFELPVERNRLWLNRLDPEQMYGVLAVEPEPAVSGADQSERAAAWRAVPALHADGAGVLRVAADAGALWIRFEPSGPPPEQIQVGFDVVDPSAGAFTLHGSETPTTPVGLEVVLVVRGDTARVLADPAVQQFRVRTIRRDLPATDVRAPVFDVPPPGVFAGRWAQEFSRPLRPVVRALGAFQPPRVITNRVRFAQDGTEYAATGYDRGVLRPGPPPRGDWERWADGSLEVRVPWLLLNVSDPSGRFVLFDGPGARGTEPIGTTRVEAVGLVVAIRRAGRWSVIRPADGSGMVGRFTWPTWEEPRWRVRRRPVFDILKATWAGLEAGLERLGRRPMEEPE